MILVTLIVMTFGLFSNECGEFVPCEKTYVKAEQIRLFENQIFVEVGDWMAQTSGIQVDANGYYFANYRKYNPNPCEKPDWKCGNCGNCNASWSWTCKECGHWKGDN